MTTYYDSRVLRGMEKMLEARQKRLDAGEKPIGWKVGFGAPASLKSLELEMPLVGFLTDAVLQRTDSTLSLASWTKPAAEPEVAVYLKEDLSGEVDKQTATNSSDRQAP